MQVERQFFGVRVYRGMAHVLGIVWKTQGNSIHFNPTNNFNSTTAKIIPTLHIIAFYSTSSPTFLCATKRALFSLIMFRFGGLFARQTKNRRTFHSMTKPF